MTELLPLYMVLTLFALLMLGYPVAFTLGGVALFFGAVGLDMVFFNLLPQRIWGGDDQFYSACSAAFYLYGRYPRALGAC